jgi:DNA-binding CsgD family transcriptional regulator
MGVITERVPLIEEFRLTPREREVLGHLLKGISNKEIASAMHLQVVTVKMHLRGVCRKLGVRNRTQAALKALSLLRAAD